MMRFCAYKYNARQARVAMKTHKAEFRHARLAV